MFDNLFKFPLDIYSLEAVVSWMGDRRGKPTLFIIILANLLLARCISTFPLGGVTRYTNTKFTIYLSCLLREFRKARIFLENPPFPCI